MNERAVDSIAPGERLAALRIIDANANRLGEGLRIVEEYVRFVLDDANLTSACKQLRHDATTVLGQIPYTSRVQARATDSDVGTQISVQQESQRGCTRDIAVASIERVQQAIRVIEEYAKFSFPALAQPFEQLRYRCYELGKAIVLTSDSQQRLANARLYVLVDGRRSEQEFSQIVMSLVSAGVDVVQLRDKSLDDRMLLSRAKLLRELLPTVGCRPLLIVNDRPDLAVLAGADGVHVGQNELTVRQVRQIVGPEMLVGVSTHSIEQARQAVADGASYLGCGPTFPSATKKFEQFPGLEFLRQVAAELGLPAFAIGGITQSNLPEVLATGFKRVAVSSSIIEAANAEEEARLMLAMLAGKL